MPEVFCPECLYVFQSTTKPGFSSETAAALSGKVRKSIDFDEMALRKHWAELLDIDAEDLARAKASTVRFLRRIRVDLVLNADLVREMLELPAPSIDYWIGGPSIVELSNKLFRLKSRKLTPPVSLVGLTQWVSISNSILQKSPWADLVSDEVCHFADFMIMSPSRFGVVTSEQDIPCRTCGMHLNWQVKPQMRLLLPSNLPWFRVFGSKELVVNSRIVESIESTCPGCFQFQQISAEVSVVGPHEIEEIVSNYQRLWTNGTSI